MRGALTKKWDQWLAQGASWKPPEGKPPCHPIQAQDPRAARMSSRKELTSALQRVLRSPTNATIKNIEMGTELAKLARAPPPPEPEARDDGAVDEEENEMLSLLAPPPPKEKGKSKAPKAPKSSQRAPGGRPRGAGTTRLSTTWPRCATTTTRSPRAEEAEDGFVVSDHESDQNESDVERRIRKREKAGAAMPSARRVRARRVPSRTRTGATRRATREDDSEDDSAESSAEDELEDEEGEEEEEESGEEGGEDSENERTVTAKRNASASDSEDDAVAKPPRKKNRTLVKTGARRVVDDDDDEDRAPTSAFGAADAAAPGRRALGRRAPNPRATELRAPGCTAVPKPQQQPVAVTKPTTGGFARCSAGAPGGGGAAGGGGGRGAWVREGRPPSRAHARDKRAGLRAGFRPAAYDTLKEAHERLRDEGARPRVREEDGQDLRRGAALRQLPHESGGRQQDRDVQQRDSDRQRPDRPDGPRRSTN